MPRNKQDRARVAGTAEHELQTVQAAMKREGLKFSKREIKAAIKTYGHSRQELYAMLRIAAAAKGLTYMSEGDYPLEPVGFLFFPQDIPADTPTVSFNAFFEGKGLDNLKAVLQENLKNLEVYRVGSVQVDAYVIGMLPNGEFGGVKTKLIET